MLGCDLTDPDAVPPAVRAAVDRLGGLDLLINNAGVGGPARRSCHPTRWSGGNWRSTCSPPGGPPPRPCPAAHRTGTGDLRVQPDGGAALPLAAAYGSANAPWSRTPTRCATRSAPTSG
ncbi:SDR family NAD(P)-dependent oxidoreductase [Micromonospora sp. M12]